MVCIPAVCGQPEVSDRRPLGDHKVSCQQLFTASRVLFSFFRILPASTAGFRQSNAGARRVNLWKPATRDGAFRERIGIPSTRTYVDEIMEKYQDYRKNWKPQQP